MVGSGRYAGVARRLCAPDHSSRTCMFALMPPSVWDEVERLALAEARLFGTRRQAITEGFRVEVEG